MQTEYSIRKILPEDNPAVERVVKKVLEEYGGNRPGTAYFDPSLKTMYQFYQQKASAYFVILHNGEVIGGGGIAPLEGAPNEICEFQKMYILKAHRGNGLGKRIIEQSLAFAKTNGYTQCYIETFGHMHAAQALYKKYGFKQLNGPLGSTGHNACDVKMVANL